MANKTTKTTKTSTADTNVAGSKNKRSLIGIVRKRSGINTVSVKVERFVKHPVYQKFQKVSKNYAAHDANDATTVGDRVEITETRPISKTKRFVVTNITKLDTIASN